MAMSISLLGRRNHIASCQEKRRSTGFDERRLSQITASEEERGGEKMEEATID
jgi:hypothetical protein